MKKNVLILFTLFFSVTFYIRAYAQEPLPAWAEGTVWYQIFPERFANGDTTNDPAVEKIFLETGKKPGGWRVSKWTGNWFEESVWEKNLGGKFNNHIFYRRYGGDIQGIIDHLDYLKKLGVGAIYINPIFDAVSLHKYDGSTFHHVDINFGPDPEGDMKLIQSESPDDPKTWVFTSADKLFLKLITGVHKRGMKIIIDGVFNHTGTNFWAFRDILKNGADSKFKDWYEIKSFNSGKMSFDYRGWNGIKSLPVFNRTDNDLARGPKQYIFNITKRWMDPGDNGDLTAGVDGWRLDVANEVPLGFWHDWRKLVKSINRQAIIIGELWGLYPKYVTKNGPFDALMNYSFAFAVNKYFIDKKRKISTTEFIDELREIDKTYPKENLDMLMNLVDSHDTERISSMIKNPDRDYDRDASYENPNYDPSKPDSNDYKRQELIFAFQVTYRGAPMIYYGDEIGMWGADDPYDRQPMVWENLKYDDQIITAASGFKKGYGDYKVKQNKNLLSYYEKLIAIRNDNPALKFGSLSFLYSNNEKDTFAFMREYKGSRIICVFNTGKNSDSFELPVEGKKMIYDELITNEKGALAGTPQIGAKLIIQIPPGSVKIYKIRSLD